MTGDERRRTSYQMLEDDDTQWPDWISGGGTIDFNLKHDHYQLISALEIVNNGMNQLSVTIEDAVEHSYTVTVDFPSQYQIDFFRDNRIIHNLTTPILANSIKILMVGHENSRSGLKFFGIRTYPAQEEFLLKHAEDNFLSLSPDGNVYLHPHNCRTHSHVLWSCENGQLKNNNGNYLKFIFEDPELYIHPTIPITTTLQNILEDHEVIEQPTRIKRSADANFVAIKVTEATIKRSIDVNFDDDYIKFTIPVGDPRYDNPGLWRRLRPAVFPNISTLEILKDGVKNDAFTLEVVYPGKELSDFLFFTVEIFFSERQFLVSSDSTECYEFPIIDDQCGDEDCSCGGRMKLCERLTGTGQFSNQLKVDCR